MLTSVNQLSRGTLRTTVITEHINENLSLINKLIIKENTLGTNKVIYELPIVFRNINVSPSVAKAIIYSSVMKELEQKGYKVGIKMNENKPLLLIEWSSGINNAEIICMEKYLQEHSI